MTREEFIAKYEMECSYYFDGYYAPCIQEFLNQIYDNFEKDMKPKTCDTFDKGASSTNYPPKTIFAFGNYYTLKDTQC